MVVDRRLIRNTDRTGDVSTDVASSNSLEINPSRMNGCPEKVLDSSTERSFWNLSTLFIIGGTVKIESLTLCDHPVLDQENEWRPYGFNIPIVGLQRPISLVMITSFFKPVVQFSVCAELQRNPSLFPVL